MGRPGVTFEEFVQAAQPLHVQRIPVTVDRVREVLGRGSRTTLLKHLQQWRQDLTTETPSFSLADFPSALLSSVAELWRQAGDLAQAQLAEAHKKLEQERSELQERDQVREGQLRTLTEQLAGTQQNEQRAMLELVACKEQLGRAVVEKRHLGDQLAHAAQEVQRLTAMLREAEQALQQHELAAAAKLREERARHDVELARWLNQLDSTKQQLREMGERCSKLERRATTESAPRRSRKTAKGNT